MNDPGYIYVKNWKKFQHPDAIRSAAMPWIKLHLDLFGHDGWLDLQPSDRMLLFGIWMCAARYGNGRVSADLGWLKAQVKVRKGSLEPLIQAGFIEVRASKARATRKRTASLEREGSKEPKKRTRASASKPQAAAVAREEEPAPNGFHGAAEARDRFLSAVKSLESA